MKWSWHPRKWEIMGVSLAISIPHLFKDDYLFSERIPLEAKVELIFYAAILFLGLGFFFVLMASLVSSFRQSWKSKRKTLQSASDSRA